MTLSISAYRLSMAPSQRLPSCRPEVTECESVFFSKMLEGKYISSLPSSPSQNAMADPGMYVSEVVTMSSWEL